MNRLAARLALATIASTGCLRSTELPDLAGQDIRLTVLHTSDIHARILPYEQQPGLIDRGLGLCAELHPFGGAGRLQWIIKRERARSARVMHLDSGDCFQGAPIFNVFKGEAEMRVMSALEPDGVVVGNHEFDLGSQNFAYQYGQWGNGRFPMLAANYIFQDPLAPPASSGRGMPQRSIPIDPTKEPPQHTLGALVKPYAIVDIDGLQVAIIGMGNTSSMTSIMNGGNSLGITPLEPLEVVRSLVEYLEPRVDLIFVVSHMGLATSTVKNLGEDTELVTGYERTVPRNAVQPNWQVMGEEPNGQLKVWVPGVVGIDAIFGGHLHIVLNPPKVLIDPAGRKVVLVHSGSFAKFLGRLDVVARVPKRGEPRPHGAEIVSHDYQLFPLTNRVPKERATAVVDCPADGAATFAVERGNDQVDKDTLCGSLFDADKQIAVCDVADACRMAGDACTDACRKARRECLSVPAPVDAEMLELLDPYVIDLHRLQDLNREFAYATDRISRFGQSGEDSPLGNLVADSMRTRNRIEADFALTNSLGIRTNMEAGLISNEQMFNIFPFENTLTTMYLSGTEVQELFDYVTFRSSERGCQTQAQISGASFTMNCAQAIRNNDAPPCTTTADCEGMEFASVGSKNPVRCVANKCFKNPAEDILINGARVNPTESYKLATNDFIGRGGSGFEVLRRNTTKVDTGLSLRDALIDYMRTPPSISGGGPGRVCGSKYIVEPYPAPVRPTRVFPKSEDVSCATRPAGCNDVSGKFLDCKESEDGKHVEFYCLPYDFKTCDDIAENMPVFETLERDAGQEAPGCNTRLNKTCAGQLHCCERTTAGGKIQATFYCMVPHCIDPPETGRITRIVQ